METSIIHRGGETDDVAVVPFSKAHLPGALKLSQEMSWPYRIEDWAFALKVGQGFVLERAGEVIGTAAWFPYGDTHATVGMIIVSGEAQGRGFGALYERRGFGSVSIIHQYQGIPKGRHETPPPDVVRAMEPSDFDAVARLDG